MQITAPHHCGAVMAVNIRERAFMECIALGVAGNQLEGKRPFASFMLRFLNLQSAIAPETLLFTLPSARSAPAAGPWSRSE